MTTSTTGRSTSHPLTTQPRPATSRRLLYPAAALAMLAFAAPAQAQHIVNASRDCTCTNLVVNLAKFPDDRMIVQFGNVSVPGRYDFAAQKIVAVLPPGTPAGTYLLSIFGGNGDSYCSVEVDLPCCDLVDHRQFKIWIDR